MRQPIGGSWLHFYSKDFPHSSRIHFVIAVISIAVFYLSYTFFPQIKFLKSIHISPAIALTIFGLLVIFFDRYVWKVLCWSKNIPVVDYSGTYEGSMVAIDKDGVETHHPVAIEIKQTWSKMQIIFKSGSAESVSISSSLIKSKVENENPFVWYNYFNEGYNDNGQRMGAHYGTTKLKFSTDKKNVEANYFTEQDRDSHGRFKLTRVIKQ